MELAFCVLYPELLSEGRNHSGKGSELRSPSPQLRKGQVEPPKSIFSPLVFSITKYPGVGNIFLYIAIKKCYFKQKMGLCLLK